jgi:putative oxidoreductase
MDLALLIARLLLGLGLAAHGAPTLFGGFGGYGTSGTGQFMASLGFAAGVPFAVLAGGGELAGGLLTATGLGGPIGPAIMISIMAVAMVTVHMKNGFFAMNNGVELPSMISAGALLIAFTGAGSYSLDSLIGIMWFWTNGLTWLVIGVGIALSLGVVALRRPNKTA